MTIATQFSNKCIFQPVNRNFTPYGFCMIKSIRHKGLRLLWENGDGNRLPNELITRIEIILAVIDSAQQVPQDFEAFRNWNIHKLTGDMKEFWSIKVNKNYRIIFKHDGQNAFDIDYIDYH